MTDQKTLAEATVRHFLDNPDFASELQVAFAAASSMRLVPASALPKQPGMPLPTEAPRLWADHPPGMKATQFVRETYAPWIEAGVLTLKAIGECDPALSRAYSNRVARHPDEAVALVRAERSDKILDPQIAIDRVRERARLGKAQERAFAHPKAAFSRAADASDVMPAPGSDVWGPFELIAAPRLWSKRDKATEKSPADFIRAAYADWLPYMARGDLYRLDWPLYQAYANQLNGDYKPTAPVEFGLERRVQFRESLADKQAAAVARAALRIAFNEDHEMAMLAARTGRVSAKTEREAARNAAATAAAEHEARIAALPVPSRLWQNRVLGAASPVEFIKTAYAAWIEAGLLDSRVLFKYDRPLHAAYARWIERYPDQALPGVFAKPPGGKSREPHSI